MVWSGGRRERRNSFFFGPVHRRRSCANGDFCHRSREDEEEGGGRDAVDDAFIAVLAGLREERELLHAVMSQLYLDIWAPFLLSAPPPQSYQTLPHPPVHDMPLGCPTISRHIRDIPGKPQSAGVHDGAWTNKQKAPCSLLVLFLGITNYRIPKGEDGCSSCVLITPDQLP